MVPAPTWSQGKPPTEKQVRDTAERRRTGSGRIAYEKRMAEVQAAAEAKSKESALKLEAQQQEAQKIAEQQKAAEVIKQQNAFQKYIEDVKNRGFITTTGRYIGDAAVKGYEQQQEVKEQLKNYLVSKGVPEVAVEPYKEVRTTTEKIIYGKEKAEVIESAREESKKIALKMGGESIPLFIPGGALVYAGEQVLTPGGQQEIAESQIFLENLGLSERQAQAVSYAPALIMGGVGAAQLGGTIKSFKVKADVSKAETDFIAVANQADDVTNVKVYSETTVGKNVVKTVGQQTIKNVDDVVDVGAGESFSVTKKGPGKYEITKDLSLSASNKLGATGKIEEIWASEAPSLAKEWKIAQVLSDSGEASGTRILSATSKAGKVNTAEGLLFQNKNVPSIKDIRITDIGGVTDKTILENVFSFKGGTGGSKVNGPSIRGFVEIAGGSIDDVSTGTLSSVSSSKVTLEKAKPIVEAAAAQARESAISSIKVPEISYGGIVQPKIELESSYKDVVLTSPKQETITKKDYSTLQINNVLQENKQDTTSYNKIISSSSNRSRSQTRQAVKQDISSISSQKLNQKQLQGLKQQSLLKQVMQQKQSARPGIPKFKPEVKEFRMSTLKLPKSKPMSSRGQIFGVQVRRYGKFKSIGTTEDLNRAIGAGVSKTRTTLGRTYKITGGNLKGLKTPKGYYSKLTKKGETVFIQKAKTSLSSTGEKREIKKARRKKK